MDKPRLMVRVREAIRVRHSSLRTEEAYLQWVRRFILFHGKRHPENMGEPEVAVFLTHLAVERNVAAATQNQALSAIVFLYSHVLGHELDWLKNVTLWQEVPSTLDYLPPHPGPLPQGAVS